MDDKSKLNNYHFGKHVFEYFPWYTYNNLDISSLPKLNEKIFRSFSFAFSNSYNTLWIDQGGNFNTKVSGEIYDGKYLTKVGNMIVCDYYKEEINDWEDIEKIRLRWMLGTKELAEEYLRVIDLYNRYFNLLCDTVYIQTEEEPEISIIHFNDFFNRDNLEVILSIIEDEDIYDFIRDNKLRGNDFFNSITKYFNSKGYLTHKQLEAVKKSTYKIIANRIKKSFVYLKTNRMSEKTISSIISYIEGTPLLDKKVKIKKFRDFILIYE